MVKTLWFASSLNGGVFQINTLIKQKGNWLLDEVKYEEPKDQGFNLTIEEATTFLKKDSTMVKPCTKVSFVSSTDLKDPVQKGKLYQFDCDGEKIYVSSFDGFLMDESMLNSQ